MKRRDFLKAVAVSAGTLIVGCGKDDDPSNNIGTNNAPTNNATNNENNEETNNETACEDGPLEPGGDFFPQSVASGDPTESTVILWTRVEDGGGDLPLELQVALDAEFEQRLELDGDACALMLSAKGLYDNCLKVRLTDLDADTHYYYRFIYEKDGTRYTTNVGRTKTAPAPDADVAVKFAFVSCQDFNGKYFNTYKQLVKDEEIDFIVHLGDYVYETTGDPQFQVTTPDRTVTFRNPADAIVFNEGTESEFFAAKSLSNYRDLYRTYRTDPWLQRAHELFPTVIIWDDHEFSDDCYGATATYFDGAVDEHDVTRRKSANQAWFEYIPVDYLDEPDFEYDPMAEYGDDIRIYRDVRWGKHVHLLLTDLRSYRSDHVIAEDMFPGLVILTQAELEAELGELPDWADPYVDIDTFDGGTHATVMTDAAATVGYSPDDVAGNVSATYVNAIVEVVNEGRPMDMQIPLIDTAGLEAGLTGLSMGKTSPVGSLGSRYFVVDEPFAAYAAWRYQETSGESEDALGPDQEAWFLDTMESSDATWKVWGNEFCLVQRAIDLTALANIVGPAFAKRFLLSAEDWDGQRNKRDELLDRLSSIENVVAITGDIHAFFAGTPFVRGDTSKRIIELVTGAVSSTSFKQLLLNTAESDPALREANAATLAEQIENFLFHPSRPNPPLAFGNTSAQGFAVVECDGAEMNCTFHQISSDVVGIDLEPAEIDEHLKTKRFRIVAGSPDLLTQVSGTEKRWDPESAAWV